MPQRLLVRVQLLLKFDLKLNKKKLHYTVFNGKRNEFFIEDFILLLFLVFILFFIFILLILGLKNSYLFQRICLKIKYNNNRT